MSVDPFVSLIPVYVCLPSWLCVLVKAACGPACCSPGSARRTCGTDQWTEANGILTKPPRRIKAGLSGLGAGQPSGTAGGERSV